MDTEKYIAFRTKLDFITVYLIDKEKIEMQINRNIFYRQPYSTEWHDYIKMTCLQISPKPENPLRIFIKLYNMINIQKPKEISFQAF